MDSVGSTSITCPVTGEVVAESNVDDLAECLQRLAAARERLSVAESLIRKAASKLASGDAATQRIRGEKYQIEVSKPPVKWDSKSLKAIWDSCDEPVRTEIMRISDVAVNMTTWKVWQNTHGSEEFESLKARIADACRGRTGMPSVKVQPLAVKTTEDPF